MNPAVVANMVLDAMSRHTGFNRNQFMGRSRRRPLAKYRLLAMTLTRWFSGGSHASVGTAFGNRSAWTSMHAEKQMREEVTRNKKIHNLSAVVTREVKAEMAKLTTHEY